ncbi:MAG: transglutaminase-like domain-containing protein, partial [Cytophagales bacterium]
IDYQENRHRWAAKEVPALKAEPFMTNSKDYVSKINFELSYTKFPNSPIKNYMGSWDDINKAYLESLGDVITGSNFLKKTTEEITAGKEAPDEKVASIFVYVRSNFLWDGTKRKYPGESLRKIFDDKKGSSAEINLLLASMLEKVDIKVNPVLVSTRDNGFVREATPVSSQFNYVVCAAQINDKIILLDATDKFLPIGVLPERCLNGNGFMVGEQGYRWVPLQPSTKARTNISVDLALLSDEGNLKGTLKIDRSGYHSVDARKSFVTKGQEEYLKDFVGSKTWELHKSEFSNEKDLQLPFKETHEVSVNEHATVAGAVYYISPFVMAKEESNPFKQEERKYPIDFGAPFDYVYFIKLTLPQGFVVEELPKSKVLALPGNAARYIFNVAQSGNSINITSNFSINKGVFL